MKFSCKNSGKCCSHPNIVVTLTHEDIFNLMQACVNFNELIKRVQFMVDPKAMNEPSSNSQDDRGVKTVIQNVKTTSGPGVFILRRVGLNTCTFYNTESHLCSIHDIKPRACKNFPFAFHKEQNSNSISVSWVHTAEGFCPGIGSGEDTKGDHFEKSGRETLNVIDTYNQILENINKEAEEKGALSAQETLMTIYLVTEKYNKKFIQKK